jgi:hypothetical protein
MPEEIELLRRFRDEVPGPSTDAWLRARAAVAAARAEEAAGDQPARRSRLRPVTVRLAMAGAAAGLAAVAGLGVSGAFDSAPSAGTGTIRTAAFTLTRHANGTAGLTFNARVISEPGTLQRDLARYGIPAIVTTGSFCSSSPAPDGFSRVVTISPPPGEAGGHQQGRSPTITIDPAALPAGAELSFGIFQPPAGPSPLTAISLTDASSYTCASSTSATPPPGGALLHVPTGS